MKSKKIILLGLVLLMTSCASYRKSASVMHISNDRINTYVAAELDYDHAKKVEGTVNYKTLFGFIQLIRNGNKTIIKSNRYSNGMFNNGISKRQSQALYRAKVNGNVDMLLEPEYEIENHSYFFGIYRKGTVKVKAWGINIKGLKDDTKVKWIYKEDNN